LRRIRRLGLDRDGEGAARERCRECERPVGADGQIVAAIILQHETGTAQPRHSAADRMGRWDRVENFVQRAGAATDRQARDQRHCGEAQLV